MKTQNILLFKREASAGVLEALDGSNVLETVGGITVAPYSGDKVTREVDSPEATPGISVNVNPHQSFSFNVDAAGSGTAGTAPVFGPLLEASGLVESIDAGNSVSYTLSNNVKSPTVSLAKYEGDDILQTGAGGRGNVVLSFDNKIPQLQFSNFLVDYIRPAHANFPSSLVYDNYADPLPMTAENTTKAKLFDRDVVFLSGSVTFGSGVTMRNVPNQKEAIHGNLFTTVTVTFVAKSLADENWFADAESHNGVSLGNFEIEHGLTSGNIIHYLSTQNQIAEISEGEQDGEKTFTVQLNSQVPGVLTFK